MLNKLPPELTGKIAEYLDIKSQASLSRVSKNINTFFNNSNNSNEFKKFRLYPLKGQELMYKAKNDIEIAKIIFNDDALLKKLNFANKDKNIIRLAKKYNEFIDMILDNEKIQPVLKNKSDTEEKLNKLKQKLSSKCANHL